MITEWPNRLVAAVYRFRLRSLASGKAQHHQLICNPWHAVSIATGSMVTGACPCKAAVALQGQRFLSAEAPKLPLRGCSNPKGCQCSYRHHADRRNDPRRAIDYDLPSNLFTGIERRAAARGRRRATDI